MKPTHLQRSGIILLLLVAMSCAKEKTEVTTTGIPVNDKELVNQVHWFIDGAKEVKEGKYLKTGEKILINDALNVLESSMNYKYGFTNEKFKDYYSEEVEITIPFISSENKTFVIDAMQAFNATLQKFREIYQQINFENKKFYTCSIQNGGITNGGNSVIIKAKVYFGYGIPISPSVNEVGYNWALNGGNCELMGQYGAPNYLRDNYEPAIYLPCPNPRVWYDQTGDHKFNEDITHYPNPNGGPIDNYCDYQLYYAASNVPGGITPEVECVGSESINAAQAEIQYYRDQLQDLIDAKLVTLNRNFMDVTFETEDVTVNNVRTLRHIPRLYYAKIHYDCISSSAPMPITQD
jgi:hypothetical protein